VSPCSPSRARLRAVDERRGPRRHRTTRRRTQTFARAHAFVRRRGAGDGARSDSAGEVSATRWVGGTGVGRARWARRRREGGGEAEDGSEASGERHSSPASTTTTRKKDYYDILGVDFEASEGEIRRAYLKLALRSHPDKHGDTAEAKAKFQEIGEAYHVLSDAERRLEYNESGEYAIDDFGLEEYLKRFHSFVLTSQGLSLGSTFTGEDEDEEVQDELRAFLGFSA